MGYISGVCALPPASPSADGRRFEAPLAYLGTAIFGELLRLSQEEFGFAGDDGRITLPCDPCFFFMPCRAPFV
jgi:hypothetical protein